MEGGEGEEGEEGEEEGRRKGEVERGRRSRGGEEEGGKGEGEEGRTLSYICTYLLDAILSSPHCPVLLACPTPAHLVVLRLKYRWHCLLHSL